ICSVPLPLSACAFTVTVPRGGAEEPSAVRNIVATYASAEVAVGDGAGAFGVGAAGVGVVLLVVGLWLLAPPHPAQISRKAATINNRLRRWNFVPLLRSFIITLSVRSRTARRVREPVGNSGGFQSGCCKR